MDKVTFALSRETPKVEWYWPAHRPDLTEQEALAVGVNLMVGALEKVADALNNIAEAIREKDGSSD